MAYDDPDLILLQAPRSAPHAEGLESGTNLILPPKPVLERLGHMPEEVYDLSPESHMVRLISAIIGDAGAGQIRKRLLMARLQRTINGSHFFDLDRFWGALFGIRRTPGEVLAFDPTGATAEPDEWDDFSARDSSFRSRIEQFARAISFGATPTGMELLAEAILSVDCDVYESFTTVDRASLTYGDLEAFTYGELEDFTYGELEGREEGEGALNRWKFIIRPRRPITPAERYDLLRVISRVKPASTLVEVSDGVEIHSETPIARFAADSEHWEIHEVIDGKPKPRPPFSGFQGAVWSYNGEISGVAASALGWAPGVTPERTDSTRYRLPNGSWLVYRPSMSLMSVQKIAARALSADGQMVAHPYATARYSSDGVVSSSDQTAPLFSNGATLNDLDADSLNSKPLELGMWVTPERDRQDRTTEVIEYRFSSPKLINTFDFEVSHYPHDVSVERWDSNLARWVSIYNEKINRSVPQYLPWTKPRSAHYLHHTSDHWVRRKVRPAAGFRTTKMRITMRRHLFESAPIMGGKRIPYSLAVRNVNIGYRVTGKESLPTGTTPGSKIAGSIDPFGEPVDYMLTTKPASNIALPGERKPFWKSEPQPVPNAVVNLYADVRTPAGEPVKIDRFYLDPTHTGVHFSIYHSDDQPDGVFQAGDEPIPYGAITVTGGVSTTSTALEIPVADTVDIENSAVRFDHSKPWMVAIQFRAPVDSAAAEAEWIIPFHAFSDPGGVAIALPFNELIPALGLSFQAGDRIGLVAQYNGETLDMWSRVGPTGPLLQLEGSPWTPPDVQVEDLQIIGTGSTEAFVLKQNQQPLTADEADDLLANLTDYPTRSEFLSDDDGGTDNALLRFHPSFLSEDNLLGFVGGPADYWAEMAWTPVARDYTTQKGYLDVPPISARFWKFEFTNLAAEPYESFVPITRKVKVFPVGAVLQSMVASGAGAVDSLGLGRFLDSISVVETADGGRFDSQDHRPTSALFATDLAGRAGIEDLSWIFAFSPWHQGVAAPSFTQVQPHTYEIQTVVHSKKLAFFVGVRELRAFKLAYDADDDTPVYYERFLDFDNLLDGDAEQPFTWELDPGRIYTVDGDPATVYSRAYQSNHPVTAIQFATQQTPSVQVLPDDTFQDPLLLSSDFTDEDSWHSTGDASLSYQEADRTILVGRSTNTASMSLFHEGGLIQEPVHPPFAAPIGISAEVSDEAAVGGIESPLAVLSAEGAIHAAARITLTEELSQPLFLEIVGVSGQVLASKEITGQKGRTIETTVSYRLGSQPPPPAPSGEWEFHSLISPPIREGFAGGDDTDLYSGPVDYETYVSDTFDRVDDTDLGSTDGTDDGDPQVWTYPFTGHDMGIVGNKATSLDVDPAYAVVPVGYGNGRVSATVGEQCGIIFRFEDLDNNWVARTNVGGSVELLKNEGGISTSIDTEACSSGEVELAVEMNGSQITVYVDGVEKITYTSTFLAGTPVAGFYVEDDAAFVSSWSFGRPIGVPVFESSDSSAQVRLVQRGSATDQWKVHALSLFDESIVWEFSNDGGQTWIPAHGIRNNPNGVLSFPQPNNQLRWRVKGFRNALSITSLQIRPWYADRLQLRTATSNRGPNVSVWDQEPPISEDPEFKVWSDPVPRSWYLKGQRYPSVTPEGQPAVTPFARFYARTADEDISGIDGTVETEGSFEREGDETFTISNTVGRSGGSFVRSATSTFNIEDEAIAEVIASDGPVIKRPIAPPE